MCGNYDLFDWVSCRIIQTCLKMQEQGGDEEEFSSLLFLWESLESSSPPTTEFHQRQSKPAYATFLCLCFVSREEAFYWPLNTVGESRTVVGGGGVVSAYSIQEVVVCRHTHSSSPLGHGRTHAPLVGVRVEALHWPQTWAAVPTTYCKQPGKLNKTGSESQTSDMCMQR